MANGKSVQSKSKLKFRANGHQYNIYHTISASVSTVYYCRDRNDFPYVLKLLFEDYWNNEVAVYKATKRSKYTLPMVAHGEFLSKLTVQKGNLHKLKHYIVVKYACIGNLLHWRDVFQDTLNWKKLIVAAKNLLYSLKELHLAGFISCSVKDENFVVNFGTNQGEGFFEFYLIDFEKSEKFMDSYGKLLKRPSMSSPFVLGTRFIPLIQKNGTRPVYPVDDLEGWFYVIYKLFCRCLPDRNEETKTWNGRTEDFTYKNGPIYWLRGRKDIPLVVKSILNEIFELMIDWGVKAPDVFDISNYDKIFEILDKPFDGFVRASSCSTTSLFEKASSEEGYASDCNETGTGNMSQGY